MLFSDLGIVSYQQVHAFQKDLVERRINGDLQDDVCLFVEHPAVLTLGKRGGSQHLKVSEEYLQNNGVSVLQTERGGEITCHGPGQCVVYPIINLRQNKLSVTSYVHLLEEVMIRTCGDFDVAASRDERNAGAWVGNNKIGSIGLGIRKGITYHGLALNATIDLTLFDCITPCGVTGIGATSIEKERAVSVDIEEVKMKLVQNMSSLFGKKMNAIAPNKLLPTGVDAE